MKKNKKNILVGILVLVMAFGLLGSTGIVSFFTGSKNSSLSTRELAMSCTLDMYTQFHIHPQLKIIINGAPQTIPAGIGISLACMHPLHTHDATGTIHVESPEQRDFTLGDFFAVWEKPFSNDQIFDSAADATHEIVMTVDGQPSQEFEQLVFKDKQQIVVEYKKK